MTALDSTGGPELVVAALELELPVWFVEDAELASVLPPLDPADDVDVEEVDAEEEVNELPELCTSGRGGTLHELDARPRVNKRNVHCQ
jgi:hypothetical protein